MAAPGELQQLQAPLRFLAQRSHTKRTEVARLELELAQARAEKSRLNQDFNKWIAYYARGECMEYVKVMHQKLPLELREMVYERLCVEPDRPIPVGPYYHFRRYDQPLRHRPLPNRDTFRPRINSPQPYGTPAPVDPNSYTADADTDATGHVTMEDAAETDGTRTDSHRKMHVDPKVVERILSLKNGEDRFLYHSGRPTVKILPDGRLREEHSDQPPRDMLLPSAHFLDPRYVGPTMSREIQKMYYARNTFSVCSIDNAIRNFLTLHSGYLMQGEGIDGVGDGLALDPPFHPVDHIRNLQVRVKFDYFRADMPEESTPYEEHAYEQHFLRVISHNVRALETLLIRRSELGVNIELIIMSQYQDDDGNSISGQRPGCLINFLQSIRNTVYRLVHDSDNSITVKVTHYDDGISPFPRDMTGLFHLTKEQWELEKSAHQGEDDWGDDFFIAPPGVSPATMPGLPAEDWDEIIRERWGIESEYDTKPRFPVRKGRYWPKAPAKITRWPAEETA
ncbi:hypothetical protein DDE83_003241 [Stemphylium lycopersici]|uniref:Uncharacterized protein n=1 Tax=Stemphylium lycopersici TaxID=183478 RepID=A0A364N834_STELY|nr:hypothetical protein DDE83_003241 [Stemphylium lycopersici]